MSIRKQSTSVLLNNLPIAQPSDRTDLRSTRLDDTSAIPSCGTGFFFFLLLTATLLVRPAEIISGLEGWPIYEVIILICFIASFPAVQKKMSWQSLIKHPAELSVLALWPAVVLSHLSHGSLWFARTEGLEFLKVLIYYILLVSVLSTRRRLHIFMATLLVLITFMAFLSVLTYNGTLDIEALKPVSEDMGTDASGNAISLSRLCGAGIFNDPNDFSLFLVVTMLIATQLFIESRVLLLRLFCATAVVPIGYAFFLTYSRGGFLSLLGAAAVFLLARFPLKRAGIVAIVLLPMIFIVFAGRQTNIDVSDSGDTAQGRMHLWRDSLVLFHRSPIFGIGSGRLADENGVVAHNSFVQGFAELGLVGGTVFVGTFLIPILDLGRLVGQTRIRPHGQRDGWEGCILAITAGYVVGLFSLTRNLEVSTYVILGLSGAFVAVAAREYPHVVLLRGSALIRRVTVVSFATLVALEFVARYLVT